MNRPRRFTAVILALSFMARPALAMDAQDIVQAAWDHWRGTSSRGEMTMTIHRPDWERSMSMEVSTRGQDESLVRVTEPRKDAGNAFLIEQDEMWTYSPKVNRVLKVPSSMMGQSWMGSDFSNKDVSRADTIVRQYDHTLIGTETQGGHRVHVIESIPHEDAAVVWGKEVLRIRDDQVLLQEDFYDQDGKLVKSMKAREIGNLGGRTLATRLRMENAEARDQWTEVVTERMRFDLALPDRIFTLSNLRNPRE